MFYTKKPQASDIQLLADFKSGERGIRKQINTSRNYLIIRCLLIGKILFSHYTVYNLAQVTTL